MNFHQTWAIVSTLAHFINHEVHNGVWMQVDDGDRVEALTGLIGCAFLSALNALDRIEELKEDSAFRDLGLVMAIYLQFSQEATTTEYSNDDDTTDWQEAIVQYAAKAEIDIADQGIVGLESLIASCESEPIAGKATATRWNWTKTVSKVSIELSLPVD